MADKQNTSAVKGGDFLTGALVITRPFHWLTLLAFVLAGAATVLWTFFGAIPQKVQGLGEINTDAGVFKVTTPYQGQVAKVNVRLHDLVKENQVLLVLKHPQMEEQIREAKRDLQLMKEKYLQLTSGNATSFGLKSGVNVVERKRIQDQVREVNNTIAYLEKKVREDTKLYADGLITYSKLFDSKTALAEARKNKAAFESEDLTLSLNNQEWKLGKHMNENDLKNQIILQEKKLADLQDQFQLNTDIRAMASGYVVSLNVGFGDLIQPNMNLATLEVPDNQSKYILDLYVPFNANARIAKGMKVDIEPFSVDRNLFGWLQGEVVDVNHFVSSGTGLVNSLDNGALAKLLTKKGPVYKVSVNLLRDPSTVSGFAWSNKKGPPFRIHAGALCKAYVRVKDKAPIDYLITEYNAYIK